VIGLIGVLVGRPWLLPSLGPSAVLIALSPAHPTARAWNTVAGHGIGIAAGFVGIVLAAAAHDPSPILDGTLTASRALAAALAVGLTLAGTAAARASHPPAAATTLLVALGAVATGDRALNLFAGVILIAIAGELMRRVRLERRAPAERMAPARSTAWSRLRIPARRPVERLIRRSAESATPR
jgi:CBS-domain-containing membrane protein